MLPGDVYAAPKGALTAEDIDAVLEDLDRDSATMWPPLERARALAYAAAEAPTAEEMVGLLRDALLLATAPADTRSTAEILLPDPVPDEPPVPAYPEDPRARRAQERWHAAQAALSAAQSARVSDEMVQRARRAPLARVLADAGITVGPGARTCRCPFHEDDTPSMSLNLPRGLWYCHACAIGGDVIAFVQRMCRLSFADAVRRLASTMEVPCYAR